MESTLDRSIVFAFAVLGGALVLFVWGRWRYDVVALLALLVVVLTGIVEAGEAFAGFGHPAVVTVAAVLVASRGLQNAGVTDVVSRQLSRLGTTPFVQVLSLTGVVAVLSAFMNNVGALALLLPVAVRVARRGNVPPSTLLMPLAFGSLLGGMTTLIGTPPNIIIASFRTQAASEPFRMFDFTPVGAAVAVASVLFVGLAGWHLIPKRSAQASPEELLRIEGYFTELRVPEGSRMDGQYLVELQKHVESEVVVVGIVRREDHIAAPSDFRTVLAGDILIVEGDSEAIQAMVDSAGLELAGDKELRTEMLGSDEVSLVEAVVAPDSLLDGRTARTLRLRNRFGVNLLAVSRQGSRLEGRLATLSLQASDVLLLQIPAPSLQDTLRTLGCLPLLERDLRIGLPRRLIVGLAIFGAAVALAATGVLPVQIAFVAGAVAMVLFGILNLREAYQAIDWPIIVLLGAMIPVGLALERTGGAQIVAEGLLAFSGRMPPAGILAVLLMGSMLLSNVVNNAAAAVLMAPIALRLATGLGVSADPLLMAVAIGASSAFLTPIGHQSNTLVMGPGGYRFADYWRLGLPLSLLIAAVATPVIPMVWPF